MSFQKSRLGVTSWAGPCRLLRAETLKLRDFEYVQAARASGAGTLRIMLRHVAPNVLHIVLITAALDFSGVILYEAVLSYAGIGVDPSLNSFGSMISADASSRNILRNSSCERLRAAVAL